MPIINFYQISDGSIEKTACQLLEKCYKNGSKTLVRVANETAVENINKSLWTFSQKAFIPHGSKDDEIQKNQPIYITNRDENPIDATMLMLVSSLDGIYQNFERIFVLFPDSMFPEVESHLEKLKAKNEVSIYKQAKGGSWTRA
ncbi:MAG: DNA polymerase III subunit chi [Rickettsiaceae bacterium]|nr:DNA polymerase III subunit chi [Rickettsiaceae bacterium]